MKKIVIIGGGNIGTLLLADLAKYKDLHVSLLTSRPEKWSNTIKVYDYNDNFKWEAKVSAITSDYSILESADLVISTLPTHIFAINAQKYVKYLKKNCYFGTMPGLGGKEFYIDNHVNYFGFQRVHGVSRIKEYGHSVYDLGKRDKMYIGANFKGAEKLIDFLEKRLMISFELVPNLLSITLTPSNPILHTSRLYCLGKKEVNGFLDKDYLFYEDWDNESSKMLIKMDEELQNICAELYPLDMTFVKSLKIHYESNNEEELTRKITSIPAFRGLKSPLIEKNQKYAFDGESRYFTEDFLYGLLVIYDFATVLKVEVPSISKVLQWYCIRFGVRVFNEDGTYIKKNVSKLPLPSVLGIDSKEKIIEYYKHR